MYTIGPSPLYYSCSTRLDLIKQPNDPLLHNRLTPLGFFKVLPPFLLAGLELGEALRLLRLGCFLRLCLLLFLALCLCCGFAKRGGL